MRVKKTIAILGDTGEFSPVLIEVFAKQKLRLLYVSENEEINVALKKHLDNVLAVAEVEFLSCEREGCWEADIIAFTQTENISPGLLAKIKEVATQKIVLVFSEAKSCCNYEVLFPFSKVVEVIVKDPGNEFLISGKNPEANAEVQDLMEGGASKINK